MMEGRYPDETKGDPWPRRRPEKTGVPVWVWLLCGGFGALSLCGCAGVVGALLLFQGDRISDLTQSRHLIPRPALRTSRVGQEQEQEHTVHEGTGYSAKQEPECRQKKHQVGFSRGGRWCGRSRPRDQFRFRQFAVGTHRRAEESLTLRTLHLRAQPVERHAHEVLARRTGDDFRLGRHVVFPIFSVFSASLWVIQDFRAGASGQFSTARKADFGLVQKEPVRGNTSERSPRISFIHLKRTRPVGLACVS